jgi:hypothetical protein
MNFQLAAIILLIVLFPVGFRMAKMKEPSSTVMLVGLLVLLLFLVSLIYLLVSSWLLFLMILGSGILILLGSAGFVTALEARRASNIPYLLLFIGSISIGGGIYLFVLSIIRCLG